MDRKEILKILMKADPFEMLDTNVLERLSRKTEVREYHPNTYIFKQGSPSLDCLFIIVSGLVEITVTNDRGIETVVALRRAYDFFGETVVISRQRYPGSARVKEQLTCCLIKRKIWNI